MQIMFHKNLNTLAVSQVTKLQTQTEKNIHNQQTIFKTDKKFCVNREILILFEKLQVSYS